MGEVGLKFTLRSIQTKAISYLLILSTTVFSLIPQETYSRDWLKCSKAVEFIGRAFKKDIPNNPMVAKRFVGIRKAAQVFNPLNYRKIKNPLPQLGRLKFFEQPDRIPLLVRYVHDIAEGEYPDVDSGKAAYLYWIIEESDHLRERNPLDPAHAKEIFGKEDPTIDDVFDELANNYNSGKNYGKMLRDADVDVLHPAAERGMRIARGSIRWFVNIFFISSGIATVTALGAGVFMVWNAWAQQESFTLRHSIEHGGSPLPDQDAQLENSIDEYISRHQSSFNFLRSSARDDIVHLPSTIATIALALDNAHYIHKDPELERMYLRVLFDINRIIRDFSGSQLGRSTQEVIDRVFSIYDADGAHRRQFENDVLNSK